MRGDRCQLCNCEQQIKWQRPGRGEGQASTHRVEPGRADFCHRRSVAVPSWAATPAGTQRAPPTNHGGCSTFFLFFFFFFAAGQQVPALQPHAEHSAAPWPRAARALPGPAASPQFPLNGHADAGRGREPAARVQPCAAITVLLIPRGFRMSQPRAPCRGQLRRGELPSLPTWCARPGARCSSSPPGKAKFTLLSHGKNRPH